MCRFYAHRATQSLPAVGPLLSDRHSLVTQSCGDLRGECHGDGWGIGYFEGTAPRVVRRPTAAAQSAEFRAIAERVGSPTVIAHVRQASVGERTEENTHPFTFARWMFVHNGTITGFEQIRPALVNETDADLAACVEGTTDSEQVFYWLLTRLRRAGQAAEGPCTDLALLRRTVAEAVHDLDTRSAATRPSEPTRLNVLMSDGAVLVATRFKHNLNWTKEPFSTVRAPGGERGQADRAPAVAVASEPIGDGRWTEVPDAHVLTVDADLDVRLSPI
ncbi:MAG: class II glutamine amidotransferase [Planctomycetia bacterium]|nr:class II glutamine amidotransferase [Planctomycetia bacterium]